MKTTFKLIGLNKGWKAAGFNSVYATVEKGEEDWFHCAFEAKKFPDYKLNSLFDMFNNSEENLWHDRNHKVVIEFDLETPLIIELILDRIEPHEASKVKCDLCGKEWVAVRPEGLIKLECPNCSGINYFAKT